MDCAALTSHPRPARPQSGAGPRGPRIFRENRFRPARLPWQGLPVAGPRPDPVQAPLLTRKLDILLVNDYGRATGGAELQMLAIRDGLRARGHRVRLFSSDVDNVGGFPLEADAACRGRTDLGQVLTQTANLDAARRLRAELRAHPPDLVHIRMFLWQLSPLILPVLRGLPVLFQAAVYKAICPNGMKLRPDGSVCHDPAGRVCLASGCLAPRTWVSTMAQLALLRRWRAHITTTATLSRRMAEMFATEGWPDVRVLPNGIDEAPLRGPLAAAPVAVYAGRLSREKGVETLLEGFRTLSARLPGARLKILGTGPEEARLRALAAPLGDRVAFLGHHPRAAMEAEIGDAWVQVVPSLWHEPFGNVTTEAMMRGTAVIASDMGGQSDIVRDGETGYLVPPRAPTALAERLHRLLSDRGRAEAMGRAGRAVALRDYSRAAQLDRIEAAHAETLRRAALRPPARPGDKRRDSPIEDGETWR